ncbi:MAG: RNB domain-containing ribonuclease [Proteobacteria bacterium]|nr:RNB domain-containing ribonuclease [Pseudomonadota bacterium]MBU1739616.1 RNB domain-containing ribonuclease [Pseudomonadota bacterium]
MAHSGRIVEYIEHGKFICALVMEDDPKRLRVLNQNGREVKLPAARILHKTVQSYDGGESREDVQRLLQAVNNERQRLSEEIDLDAIWELASEGGQESFTPLFLAGLCFGEEPSEEQVAAFLRAVFADRFFFKFREGLIVVHPPEVVAQLRERAEREKESETFLAEGGSILLAIEKGDGATDDHPARKRILDLVRGYYLYGNDFEDSALARELLKQAGFNGDHDPYHLLVKAGFWQQDENYYLERFEVPTDFPEEVQAEAASCIEPDLDELLADGYRDLTDLPLITIDGALTRDFDDALHIEKIGENFRVGIHVADVSRYVKPRSPLFLEAEKRCTSLYFADRQIPMLPAELSEGACSLVKDRIRPVISVLALLTPAGEVLEYKVVRGVVRVRRQLSYEEANSLLADDPELAPLDRLGQVLRKNRIDNGALLMPIPDVLIDFAEDGEIRVTLADADSGARALIAEFMVLANTLGASYVADREVPGLFRSQEAPHRRLSEGFHRELYLNLRQRKYLRPAMITTTPKPHSCVGAVQYTTMTSPIRRFFDLVMQHQLSAILKGERMRFSKSELNGFIASITRLNSRANLVRRLRHRYWLLKYLVADGRERFPALVVDKGPRKVVVVLTDILLEGDLPPNQGARVEPGDMITVKLAKVSPLDDILRLEW